MEKRMKLSSLVVLALSLMQGCSMFFAPEMHDDADGGLSSLSFDRSSLQVRSGGMDILSLTASPESAQSALILSWEYDSTVISVLGDTYNAVITGLAPGSTTLRAQADSCTATCVVTVTADTVPQTFLYPYVSVNTDLVQLSPGTTEKITATLAGGLPSDLNGFSYTIDKPAVASLSSEGNYLWITGQAEGAARISVRHPKASYPSTFLVSCRTDGQAFPYITTASNIITINKSLENQSHFSVELKNAQGSDLFAYTLTDADGNALANPPVGLAASANQGILTPITPGECYLKVTHDQALYPLTILVRVIENIDTVYIEPSSSLVQVFGTASQTVSVSLMNLPPSVSSGTTDFSWTFPDDAATFIDTAVYGGEREGKGNQLWITGKKQGMVKVTVSHPLSSLSREIIIMVSKVPGEAAAASTFITTSQNYVQTYVGAPDTTIAISINNAPFGAENDLSWRIENNAADGSGNPVIAFVSGTGSSASVSAPSASIRSIAPLTASASGYAVISPLRIGTAAVTISHPKAVYDTKLLIAVTDAASAPAEQPDLVLSTNLPYLALKNNDPPVSLEVTLAGSGKTLQDENDLSWQASGALSLSALGASAQVGATGSGFSRETITVSHPKARYPLEIAVTRADTQEELAAHTTLLLSNRYRTLAQGASDFLSASLVNASDTDSLSWNVISGNTTVITFEQESNTRARITGLSPGTASVAVSAAGQSSSFEITVTAAGIISPGSPCYLTASQNVTVMDADETSTLSITPVNIAQYRYGEILWETTDTHLIELIPNGDTATVRTLAHGKAKIIVSHPLAANSLELFVHSGDEFEYKASDTVYISTPLDTVLLTSGSSEYLLQAVLTHTHNQPGQDGQDGGFSFQVRDPTVASVQPAGTASCLIAPQKPGQTILSISHPLAVFPKEILIIVDQAPRNIPYITTSQNVITVLSGEYTTTSVQLLNADSYTAADWSWTIHDQNTASIIANNGSTAMIAGNTPGASYLSVSNRNAAHPLSLILICLDKKAVQLHPWIKTSANIITIKKGSSASLTAEMIGGSETDNAFFSWSTADPLTVLLSPGTGSASVRGLKAGETSLTVRNTAYPDAYQKTVLVIVEDAIEDSCYITTNIQIIKLKPTAQAGTAVTATLVNGSILDAENFIWWADDYRIVSLSSITNTANIQPTGRSGTTIVHVRHPKALAAADIVVMVSAFDHFAFARPSLTIPAGEIAFIPLQIPAVSAQPALSFESLNPGVCAVAGSNAVAMLAGITPGTTTVRASLAIGSGPIETTDLAVIVSPPAPNSNKITTPASLITLEYNRSIVIGAEPSGPTISPGDKYNLSWSSSDPSVVEIRNGNGFQGDSASLTAKNSGEAVISVSHPKCPSPLSIWVKVPDIKEKSLSLDQSYIQLFRNEGNAAVTATIYNGSSADYNTILWTASKSGALPVVSLLNTSGRTCTVLPRNAGQTILRAQLPNGDFQDCLINISSDATLSLETLTVHINPRYSQTVKYTLTPENANVTWFSQAQNAANTDSIFSYRVDPVEKQLVITGNSLGSGSISGYITSTSGAKMVTLQVFIEYTYSFSFIDFSGHPVIPPDRPFTVKFKVFPPDLEVAASCSAPDKLSMPPKATVDPLTGLGQIVCTPQGEAPGITLSLTGSLPTDQSHTPIGEASGQRIIDLMYTNYHITPTFDIQAGSFSSYSAGTLYLGDGEEMVFSLDINQLNAQPSGVKIEWIPPPGNGSLDIREKKNGGRIILSTEGTNRFRIKHDTDYAPTDDYYLISMYLFYDIDELSYTLTGAHYGPWDNGYNLPTVLEYAGYEEDGSIIYRARGPVYTDLGSITPEMPDPKFYSYTTPPDSDGYTTTYYYLVTATRKKSTYSAKNREGITRWAVKD
jgi:hypothetical protein